MYQDILFRFSNAQTLAAASPIAGTDVVDLHPGSHLGALIGVAPARNIGPGSALEILFTIVAAVVRAAGVANLYANVFTNDTANNTTTTLIGSTALFPKTTTIAGFQFSYRIPSKPGFAMQRYLGVEYIFDNQPDSGTISAALVIDVQANPS